MRIRKAHEEDINAIIYIENNCGYPLPQYALTEEHFLKILKGGIVLLAEINNKPFGYATVRKSFRDGSELDAIGVLRKYHRKGVGTELLKKIISEVKRLGKKKLYSYCWQMNFPSIAFHNKNKFHVIELTRRHYSGGEIAMLFCKELRLSGKE